VSIATRLWRRWRRRRLPGSRALELLGRHEAEGADHGAAVTLREAMAHGAEIDDREATILSEETLAGLMSR
jgi:hypothetical protein